ncbi:condensation domain-containing protein, partial [Ruminococcus flavefaciens]|uniref:condensation domain-containing protein n=1 Tax=Ruminococcus flavefaciens TaxID=1265 RepID=UPI000561FE82
MEKKITANNKIENIYSLTPLQEGMLFHSLYDLQSSSYVLQNVSKVDKKITFSIIEDALKLLSKKYQVLRTLFFYDKIEVPQQIVLKERKIETEIIDLSDISIDKLNYEEKEIAQNDIKRGFDLQKDSLLRVKYIITPENKNRLIWTIHHIIIDGWCFSKLYSEFSSYCVRLLNGESFLDISAQVENELKQQYSYSDYVKWLIKQDKEKAIDYWISELEGYENNTEIKPTIKPESTEEQVKEKIGLVSSDTTNKLKSISEKNDTTINVIAETAVGILLQKYSGSKDVVFGKVVSGRNAPIKGIEDIVGLFVNTIPVRVTVDEKTTVSDLLKTQQEKGAESTNYDYCSLAEIQSKTPQGSNLIKVIYVFENYSFDDNNGSIDDTDSLMEVESVREQTNYDLSVSGFETDGKLGFKLMYNPNIYCENEVQIILDRLIKICEEIAEKPGAEVSELDTVTSSERSLILNDFNATETEYPREKTVAELFEEQVKKT